MAKQHNKRARILGWLASSVLVGALVGGLWVRGAAAELAEGAVALGPQLADFGELLGQETQLELNGVVLHLSVQTIERELGAVLDRFEQLCAESAPRMTAELLQAQATESTAEKPFLGVVHEGSVGRRAAVCLAQPQNQGLRELAARAVTSTTTGDLSLFGQLRYLFARSIAPGRTQVVLAWHEGPLPARAMFPAHGDAMGSDLAGIARPHAGRRVLSAQVAGRAYGLVAYEVAGSPAAALRSYTEQLAQTDFRVVPLGTPHGEPTLAGALRGPETAVVQSFRQGARTIVTLTRLGNRDLRKTVVDGAGSSSAAASSFQSKELARAQ